MGNQKINIQKNYRIPEDYFDRLEEKILSKTIDQKPAKLRRLTLIRPWMSMAAAMVILCCLGAYWVWNHNQSSVKSTDQTEENILEGMEEELFAALFVETDEEHNALADLADFLIELEEEVED